MPFGVEFELDCDTVTQSSLEQNRNKISCAGEVRQTDLYVAQFPGQTAGTSTGETAGRRNYDHMKELRILGALSALLASAATHAATYYVKPDGSDAANGMSHATAWKTVSKVNAHSFNRGDDVLFLSGGIWEDSQLTVDWNGTKSDPVVIGTYWLKGGDEIQGIGPNGRAVINGTYESRCRASKPSTCPVDTPAAVPSSMWEGLIQVAASHVTVRDIKVSDSSGSGVRHVGAFTQTHLTIDNVIVNQTYNNGIWLDKASYDVVRNSEVNLAALQKVDGRESSWPAAITTNDANPANVLIENNKVTNSGGEGIIAIRSTRVVIRENTVADNRRPLVLLDNTSDSIVERNMLVGNGYMNGKDESFGVAVGISVEPFTTRTIDSVRNIVRHNLIANTKGCFNLSVFRGSNYNCGGSCNDPAADGRKLGARIHGNTCVQNKAPWIAGNNLTVNDNVDKVDFANNILAGKQGANCDWPSTADSVVTFRNNLFTAPPSDPDCKGSDQVVGDPKLGGFNFLTANASRIPAPDDFRPTGASAAIAAGIPLTRTVIDLSKYNPEYSRGAAPCGKVDVTELSTDYQCASRGNKPDIGAFHGKGSGSWSYLLSVD